MPTRRCEDCRAEGAKLRCTKCKAIFYCSKACQSRNWKLHKRVCTTDPSLQAYIPVEMAVDRILAKLPPVQAPQDATCFICLEGDGASSKLMRGCACRGDSAGFVHLECLTKLAMSKEASRDGEVLWDAWIFCGNCKQRFTGALELEMLRRCLRRYRSSQNLKLRYNSTRILATCLGVHGEFDAAHQLFDEAATCAGNDTERLLDLKHCRAALLTKNGQRLEALELLRSILPEAKQFTTTNPGPYARTMMSIVPVFFDHDNQAAYDMATELLAFTKANYSLENITTIIAMDYYGIASAKLGRIEESKAMFKTVLAIKTRVYGRDHSNTEMTRNFMRSCGFADPSG